MKTLGYALLALLLMLGAAPASATIEDTYPGWKVDSWHAVWDLQPDGSADVRVEFDYNFGDRPARGPVVSLITRQQYDDEFNRLYRVTNVRAASPTGAPARVHLDQGENLLQIRIGEERVTDVSGVHTYVLEYTMHGVITPITAQDMGGGEDAALTDEFYMNVLGDMSEIPIQDVTIEVRAPAYALNVRCFSGPIGGDAPCDEAMVVDGVSVADSAAVFTQSLLLPGEPLSVAVEYAPGEFQAEPELEVAHALKRAFALNPLTIGLSSAILIVGLTLWIRALRTKTRDEQFAGLTPGLSPLPGHPAAVTHRNTKAPIAVQFEPPPGMRPGQLGTLLDEKADPRDVTATMVDLAVRGYLRVEESGTTGRLWNKETDYALVKLREADAALFPYEQMLFDGLFKDRNQVTLSELKTTFAADMIKVQSQLYKNVTNMGWFRGNPSTARGKWSVAGAGLVFVGVALTMWQASDGTHALVPLPMVLIGLAVLATRNRAPARTAEGTRVLTQAQGFELYIETADANQLRFEEGHDIFSQYLPYAIAFGVADKWAKKFEDLAAQGHRLAEPTWYGGYAAGAFWANSQGFGQRIDSFASAADAAISAATAGSSGGSGFSGGGSSGGGGGGGGVGGW